MLPKILYNPASLSFYIAIFFFIIDIITTQYSAIFYIAPGFTKLVEKVSSMPETKSSFDYCQAFVESKSHKRKRETPVFFYKGQKIILFVQKDFKASINITVKSIKPQFGQIISDPAILIQHLGGNKSCQDERRTNKEVMNYPNFSDTSKNIPLKGGIHVIEIFSYNKPAKEHEIIIKENN